MRIILKPAGLAVIVVMIALLAVLAFKGRGGGATSTAAAESTPAASDQATAASPGGTADGVTTTVAAIGAQAPAGVVHTREHALLNPDPTGQMWTLIDQPRDASSGVFPCTLPGSAKFMRITVNSVPTHPWDVQIRQVINHPIAMGAHVRVRIWLRSKDGCPITAVCEQSAQPYAKLMTRTLNGSPNWQQFDVDWISDRDVTPGWAELDLQCGAKVGQIDLASASMVSSTATT